MQHKFICRLSIVVLLAGLFSGLAAAGELEDLFSRVERLNIGRHGYVLGAVLNSGQLKTAAQNPLDAGVKDTFKFKDGTLHVVAQKTTNRVLVIYEQWEAATRKTLQDLIGDLYLNFDDPTVLAHDKVIYWAYTKEGKISSTVFEAARKEKKTLDILATIKCISDLLIMEKQAGPQRGQAYYIISSDPILKFFMDQKT